MSIEAEIAREVALQFECKLDALRRNQDGTVKLTLTVNPDDFPRQLMTDPMGQRYIAVMVAMNDDETPKITAQTTEKASLGQAAPVKGHTPSPAPSKRWNDMSYAQRSGVLCLDRDFWTFIGVESEADACEYLRNRCGVVSRREIDTNPDSVRAFDVLYNTFDHWRKYERNAA